MDDVLDSICPVHMHRNFHRRVPVMVPLLLRGQDSAGAVAALAGDQRLLHLVQEVRASGVMQEGTGMIKLV